MGSFIFIHTLLVVACAHRLFCLNREHAHLSYLSSRRVSSMHLVFSFVKYLPADFGGESIMLCV